MKPWEDRRKAMSTDNLPKGKFKFGEDEIKAMNKKREELYFKGELYIGRNETCYCGSNKKFKKCCIDKKKP